MGLSSYRKPDWCLLSFHIYDTIEKKVEESMKNSLIEVAANEKILFVVNNRYMLEITKCVRNLDEIIQE